MKIHQTSNGDRFLADHIDRASWSQSNRMGSSRRTEDRVTRFLTISAAVGGILGFLAIVTLISR